MKKKFIILALFWIKIDFCPNELNDLPTIYFNPLRKKVEFIHDDTPNGFPFFGEKALVHDETAGISKDQLYFHRTKGRGIIISQQCHPITYNKLAAILEKRTPYLPTSAYGNTIIFQMKNQQELDEIKTEAEIPFQKESAPYE